MNTDIQKWIKRSNRKAARLVRSSFGVHTIVYQDRGKVRIGEVRDGMYCRYGVGCRGAMLSDDDLSLWQSCANAVTKAEVKIMQDYYRGECDLPEFDFGQIKDLRW